MTLTIDQPPNCFNCDAYGTLLARTQPHVIYTEKEYNEALAFVEKLMHSPQLSPEEDQLFELLLTLIEKYEEEQHPIKTKSTPLERLKFLMEENNLKQVDLAPIFGSRGTTSEVLSGKREISKNAAIKLGERFRLPSTYFMV